MKLEKTPVRARGCLFCRLEGKSFRKTEHIIPESLGNKNLVLNGIVCDKCNSYFSALENYFIHHHMSSSTRVISLQKTKKGKPPKQNLVGGVMSRQDSGRIECTQQLLPGLGAGQFSITFDGDGMSLSADFLLPDADAKKLSRTLAKCGLELLYHKQGELAYEVEFDPIRRYARYGGKPSFIPFLWQYQNGTTSPSGLGEIEHKKEGVFRFASISVPGCVYFIFLNRFDEPLALNWLAEKCYLNKVSHQGSLKREPIRLNARFLQQKGSA